MGKTIAASITLLFLTMVFVALNNIQQVQIIDARLDQVDTFLIKKVSTHLGFTPHVENELYTVLDNLNLDRSSFDFSGTTMEEVEWGESVYIQYEYKGNLLQRGLEFIGLPKITFQPRSYHVVATGRGI